MTETKSVKALKKQLAAAIAMVVVAAIALGSSTYAWFVSNNTVTATTTNISAQSNSAFLLIQSQLLQQVQEQNPDSMKQGERLTMHISEVSISSIRLRKQGRQMSISMPQKEARFQFLWIMERRQHLQRFQIPCVLPLQCSL